uniref:Uncharacterized protein n=1 Tax=Acrobeloides nanus TaxID=290746 RepID=A0A914BYA7_9BILA
MPSYCVVRSYDSLWVTRNKRTLMMFVDQEVMINHYVYMDMLQEHFSPWAEEHLGDEEWCFQQDSAQFISSHPVLVVLRHQI